MKQLSKMWTRAVMALGLAVAIVAGPLFGSYAQSVVKKQSKGDGANDNSPGLVTEAITAGVVTTSGTVKVNDDVVQTGTTILSGSIITTGDDGKASIDMGHQGVLDMDPHTKLWLNVPGGPIKVDLRQCGRITETVPAGVAALVAVDKQSNIRVTVHKGRVKVTRDGNDIYLKDKDEKTFDKVWLVTGISDSVFTLDCDNAPAAIIWPTPMNFLAVLMTAAGLTTSLLPPKPTPRPTPPIPTPLF
ncbi:MAG TPA: hypothetical protein VI756_32675 [Blastocatellia bacterium]